MGRRNRNEPRTGQQQPVFGSFNNALTMSSAARKQNKNETGRKEMDALTTQISFFEDLKYEVL